MDFALVSWQHDEPTYILHYETSVPYGLCCFDPPAPVGGQDGSTSGDFSSSKDLQSKACIGHSSMLLEHEA